MLQWLETHHSKEEAELITVKGRVGARANRAKEWVLCGVEFDEEEEGDGVVRVREGVRRRGMGFRKETFFHLSERRCLVEYKYASSNEIIYLRFWSSFTFGSDLRLTEWSYFLGLESS